MLCKVILYVKNALATKAIIRPKLGGIGTCLCLFETGDLLLILRYVLCDMKREIKIWHYLYAKVYLPSLLLLLRLTGLG